MKPGPAPASAPRGPALRLLVAALGLLLTGCGAAYPATPLPPAAEPPSAAPSAPSGSPVACERPTASYEPLAALPKPGSMPAGSPMARIAQRGRVVAGVSADTYLMGSRNPETGQIEGFDIDLVKALAKAIFGDEKRYELRVITAADRIPLLESGGVDVVARNFSITCARWQQIAFSAEYYRSGQKMLVREGDGNTKVSQLNGKRVCAPTATSSLSLLQQKLPQVIAVPAATHTGCLILFQRGEVDGITGDDTVLAGLAAQDPYAVVLAMDPLSAEPYGLGFRSGDVQLVRFANAVLAQRVRDGEWQRSYDRWLAPSLGKASAPAPVYGRR